ncbi:MAG: hypothetical protein JNK44_11850 [Cyclobacteriaceae bacterium]|nr:hypothetical protein [Cyclobacteriaceae bacterium]
MKRHAFLLFFYLAISLSGLAQKETITPMFQTQEPLTIRLNFSVKEIKKIKSDTVYTTSYLQYKSDNGSWDSVKIGLRTRGNFRRANCTFPPLRVKMKKGDGEKTPFAGNKSLKLVVPCQSPKTYNDLITKEFICYKLYEVISPYHFNTRLVDLTLVDGKGKQAKTYNLMAFFIEDDDLVAKRHKAKVMDELKIHPLQLVDTASLKQDFFQYMISNSDWSSVQQHNIKVLQLKSGGYIPLPYDFDMSGVVNAPYSTVSELLETTTVRERVYRGFCRSQELFEYVRKEYLQLEPSVKNVVNGFESQLNAKEIAGLNRYLDEFFAILKSDKSFKENIVQKCRTK